MFFSNKTSVKDLTKHFVCGIVKECFKALFNKNKGAYILDDNLYIHFEREAAKLRHPAFRGQINKKRSGKTFIKSVVDKWAKNKEQK